MFVAASTSTGCGGQFYYYGRRAVLVTVSASFGGQRWKVSVRPLSAACRRVPAPVVCVSSRPACVCVRGFPRWMVTNSPSPPPAGAGQ